MGLSSTSTYANGILSFAFGLLPGSLSPILSANTLCGIDCGFL